MIIHHITSLQKNNQSIFLSLQIHPQAATGACQRLDELATGHQLGHHSQGLEPRLQRPAPLGASTGGTGVQGQLQVPEVGRLAAKFRLGRKRPWQLNNMKQTPPFG